MLNLEAFADLLGVDLDAPAPGEGGSTGNGGATTQATQQTTSFYDAAGNMIANPQDDSHTYAYDAWNQMVAYKENGDTVKTYAYDGQRRQISYTTTQGQSTNGTTHNYHNDGWQLIEQRHGTTPNTAAASAQFVQSAAYIDAPSQEKRDTDGNGTLDRTLQPTYDANFNVTAAVATNGEASECYLYDPYGGRSLLNNARQPPTTT